MSFGESKCVSAGSDKVGDRAIADRRHGPSFVGTGWKKEKKKRKIEKKKEKKIKREKEKKRKK